MKENIHTGYPLITPSIQVLCAELIARVPYEEGKADTGPFFVGWVGWRISVTSLADGGFEIIGGAYCNSVTDHLADNDIRLSIDWRGRLVEGGSAFSSRINWRVPATAEHMEQLKIAMTAFIAHDVENPLKMFQFLDECRGHRLP